MSERKCRSMQLEMRTCKLLLKELRQCLPVPAALFDLSGNLLGCTDDDHLPRLEQLNRLILANPDPDSVLSARGGARYMLCDADDEDVGYILMLHAADHPEYQPLVQTLTELCLTNQTLLEQQHTDSNDRLSFVYQVLSSSYQDNDTISSRAAKLKYDSYLPRCAIIFMLTDPDDKINVTVSEEITRRLLQLVQETPGFNKNDFGDFLTNRQLILFKTVPVGSYEQRKAYVSQYVQAILAESDLKKSISVGVGTVYQDLAQMRESYREAQFVIKNLSVLDSPRQLGFAGDYTYDYLMSLLPRKQQKKHLEPLAEKLRSVSYLPETIKALVAQNCNLTHCAKQLGIHRNTMRQRYTKLVEVTGLDPLHSASDMLLARQCAVYLNQKTMLHAGIIIQGNSDLHRGARHFSSLLEIKSGNRLSVEVLNVGISGNNGSLLELLMNGTLDFIVIDPEPLASYIGDQITVLNLPHIFNSYEDAYDLLTGPVGETLDASLKDVGLVSLGFWTMGWRYLSSRECLKTPQEMQGKRVRTMSKPVTQQYIRFLDAEPIPISYDNIMSALVDQLVDLQENPYVNFKDMRFYEQHGWILEENSFFSTCMLITSTACLDSLSPEQQQIIFEAAKEATYWQWEQTKQHNLSVQRRLEEKYGVQIYHPTPQEQMLWCTQAEEFKKSFSHQNILRMIDAAREERLHGIYPQNGL